MGVLQLLAKENYIAYHKTLARIVGVDEAILFGELCSMSNLYGDEFFCEQSKLINDTCLTEYRIRNALKNLQKEGLVSVVKKGLPAKNWYTLNEDRLLELLDGQSTSGTKFDTTASDKIDSTSEVKSDSTSEVESDSTFSKNTGSKNTGSKNTEKKEIYNAIISRLNEEAGTSYRPTSKSTQQHINARLAEGYTVEDFFVVIAKKCAEWKGTDMEKYLRPETLFGNKFEGYLNGKVTKSADSNIPRHSNFDARAAMERALLRTYAEKEPPKTAADDETIRARAEALRKQFNQEV